MASELKSLLSALVDADVELVVVGGLAAVAQGAPVTTFDVDIVHHRTPENVARLVRALTALDARYRGHTAVLRPTAEILSGPGHSLLMTALGPLDVLGAIEGGLDYPALLPDTVVARIGGAEVRLLGLAKLVELKRASSRPKDQQMLAVLEATLRERDG